MESRIVDPWENLNATGDFDIAPFQVDENGKITRLRKECTSESCGAGVFMAAHFDRYYCGKCYMTLVYSEPQKREKPKPAAAAAPAEAATSAPAKGGKKGKK